MLGSHRQIKAGADLGFELLHRRNEVVDDRRAVNDAGAALEIEVDSVKAIFADDSIEAIDEVGDVLGAAQRHAAILSAEREHDLLAGGAFGGDVGDELRFAAGTRVERETDRAIA